MTNMLVIFKMPLMADSQIWRSNRGKTFLYNAAKKKKKNNKKQ